MLKFPVSSDYSIAVPSQFPLLRFAVYCDFLSAEFCFTKFVASLLVVAGSVREVRCSQMGCAEGMKSTRTRLL